MTSNEGLKFGRVHRVHPDSVLCGSMYPLWSASRCPEGFGVPHRWGLRLWIRGRLWTRLLRTRPLRRLHRFWRT